MAQNITLLNSSYSDVPAILLPKTGGGTARFDDATVTTATASDVASGKVFLASDGTITTGTASGGGTDYFFELNNFYPNKDRWGMTLDLRNSHYPYVDFANGDYLEVEWLDTGITTSPNMPNIFGIGTSIYSWSNTTNIIFYLNYSNGKTAPTLRVHQNGVDTESATYDPSVPHTFKIDKNYIYLDGTAIVAPNPSVVSNTYPEIGAVEGNARYYGIYNHIRVAKGA